MLSHCQDANQANVCLRPDDSDADSDNVYNVKDICEFQIVVVVVVVIFAMCRHILHMITN